MNTVNKENACIFLGKYSKNPFLVYLKIHFLFLRPGRDRQGEGMSGREKKKRPSWNNPGLVCVSRKFLYSLNWKNKIKSLST